MHQFERNVLNNGAVKPACPDHFGEPVEGGLHKRIIPALRVQPGNFLN